MTEEKIPYVGGINVSANRNPLIIKPEWDTFAIVLHGKAVLMGKRWTTLDVIIKAASGIFGDLRLGAPQLIVKDDYAKVVWDDNHKVEISSAADMIKHHLYDGSGNARAALWNEIGMIEAEKLRDVLN